MIVSYGSMGFPLQNQMLGRIDVILHLRFKQSGKCTQQMRRPPAPIKAVENRQNTTQKNARELLLLPDVIVPDMVVIFDMSIIVVVQ